MIYGNRFRAGYSGLTAGFAGIIIVPSEENDNRVKLDNNDGGCQGMNVVNVGDNMGDEKYETNEQMNVQSVSCAAHLTPSTARECKMRKLRDRALE